jgi:hypothetical protein
MRLPLLHADMRRDLTNESPTRPALLEPSKDNENESGECFTDDLVFNGLHSINTIKKLGRRRLSPPQMCWA